MVITQHGVSAPFYKGVASIGGKRLTFFSRSIHGVVQKEHDWIESQVPQPKPQQRKRPSLRVIQGGKGAAA